MNQWLVWNTLFCKRSVNLKNTLKIICPPNTRLPHRCKYRFVVAIVLTPVMGRHAHWGWAVSAEWQEATIIPTICAPIPGPHTKLRNIDTCREKRAWTKYNRASRRDHRWWRRLLTSSHLLNRVRLTTSPTLLFCVFFLHRIMIVITVSRAVNNRT